MVVSYGITTPLDYSRNVGANDDVEYITKTYLYNVDPLKPHFYIVKLGFTGVYLIFLIFCSKHRLWVLRGGSNEYPQSLI